MMIQCREGLLRVCPTNKSKLEISRNNGSLWMLHYPGNSIVGEFIELMDGGNELLAQTTKGLFYSISDGKSWIKRR